MATAVGVRALPMLSILLLALSGCVTEDSGDPVEAEEPEPFSIRFPLSIPIVINETLDGEGFDIVLPMDRGCRWDVTEPYVYYKLFDRHGLVHDEVLELEPDSRTSTFYIPLEGEPPYLFMGDDHHCGHGWFEYAHNLTDAYPLVRDVGYDANDDGRNFTFRLGLKAGQERAETTWEGDWLVRETAGTSYQWIEGSRGRFRGDITITYLHGPVWREDQYVLNGALVSSWDPMMYFPGEYPVVIESSVPSPQDMEIEFTVYTFSMDERICAYGFEWEIC